MAGFFICIDGVDGAGKSTQIQLLQDWFASRGRVVKLVRDPGGTPLGEALREILLHRKEIPLGMTAEMLMYMASRAQLVQDVVLPDLDAGCVVIADRFLLANVVYQGSAGGLDTEAIWKVGKLATQGLVPDLTFILDIDAESSMNRIEGGLDRLESRGLEYMRKVRDGFLNEGRKLADKAIILDATLAITDVHQQITDALTRLDA